jgi:hypothetical protein
VVPSKAQSLTPNLEVTCQNWEQSKTGGDPCRCPISFCLAHTHYTQHDDVEMKGRSVRQKEVPTCIVGTFFINPSFFQLLVCTIRALLEDQSFTCLVPSSNTSINNIPNRLGECCHSSSLDLWCPIEMCWRRCRTQKELQRPPARTS